MSRVLDFDPNIRKCPDSSNEKYNILSCVATVANNKSKQ